MPDPRTNRPQHRTIAVQFEADIEADSSLTTIRISSYIPAVFEDSALRLVIYDEIVRTGETPVVATLARLVGASLDDVRASLRRMHDAHMLVLEPTGEILMANPFSAVPTPFVAEVGGSRWFGNCVWDALGIIATLHADGRVLASCGSSGERMELSVSDGVLAGQGIVHFALPARRWWEDIVFN
jgi:Alkylmercury lyase